MMINVINSAIVAPLTAGIGIYPYLVRPNKITKYFALANITLAFWNMSEVIALWIPSHDVRLWFYRLNFISAILMVPCFFRFMLAFVQEDLSEIKILWRSLVVCGAILLVLIPTPLLIADLKFPARLSFEEIQGPLYPLFVVYLLGGLGYGLFQVFKAYRYSQGHHRTQLKYLFAALIAGFIEAVFFFISVYFLNISSYYYYLQIVYVFLVAYAILAHRLMDITVILRKTAIYSVVTGSLMAVYLLVASFLAGILQSSSGSPGFWSSAVAALTIAFLFNPLLNRVRSFMDEKFFGNWLRDMSRGVVHEVKRPLASISMPAQLTLMDLEDIEKGKHSFEKFLPEFKERMRGIIQKTMEAADCIEALYAMSGSNGSQAQAVELNQVVRSGAAAAKGILETSSVRLDLEIAAEALCVRGYSKQLEIVLANLIKNGSEAMAESGGGTLRIKASEEGKWAVLSVKDTGRGIKLEDREQLFNPNFTTKGSKGMGLGLYLCDKIVREHDGSIEVKSEEGKGTEFIVRLPKHTEKGSVAA